MDFVGKVMSLLFNILSRFVTVFIQRRKCLLISRLQSPSAVILELKKIVCHCFHCFPTYIGHDVMGLDAMIFVFWMFSFKPAFSLSSFTLIKRLFNSSLLSAIREVSSAGFPVNGLIDRLVTVPLVVMFSISLCFPIRYTIKLISHCCCLVAKFCPTFCDPVDCSPPGSLVHGISQARILKWVAIFLPKSVSNLTQNHNKERNPA